MVLRDGDDATLERARVLCELHPPEAATALLASFLGRNPGQADGWRLLTAARLAIDEPVGALQAAETAVSLAPDDPRSHATASRALRGLERYAEAVAA